MFTIKMLIVHSGFWLIVELVPPLVVAVVEVEEDLVELT